MALGEAWKSEWQLHVHVLKNRLYSRGCAEKVTAD